MAEPSPAAILPLGWLGSPGFWRWSPRVCAVLGVVRFRKIGSLLGWLWALSRPSKLDRLRHSLAQLNRRPVSRHEAARALAGFGAMIADYIAFGFLDKRRIRARLDDFDGNDILRKPTPDGRGVILVTANYGLHELGLVSLDAVGRRSLVPVSRHPAGPIEAWRRAWRKRWLARSLPAGEAPFSALPLLQALRAGAGAAFLLDDPPAGPALPFPTPLGDLHLSTAPARLSWLTGCDIVMAVVRPLARGRYRLVTRGPIRPANGTRAEIERCTRELGEILLQEIRHAPQFWHALYTGSLAAAQPENAGSE